MLSLKTIALTTLTLASVSFLAKPHLITIASQASGETARPNLLLLNRLMNSVFAKFSSTVVIRKWWVTFICQRLASKDRSLLLLLLVHNRV
jgi:hypothetical protein